MFAYIFYNVYHCKNNFNIFFIMKKTLLLAVSALAFAACGGGNNNQTPTPQTPETQTESTENQPAPQKNTDGQIVLSGSIDKNVTWKDLGLPVDYVVEGEIRLDGNSLVTVEPGVTIMFSGTDGKLIVGENAGIKMQGTQEKPIVLTGPVNNPNAGSWGFLEILSKRSDNTLEYVTLKNGGESDFVLKISGSASVKNCTVNGANQNGIYILKTTAFENNTVKNCKEFPVVYDTWTENTTFGGKNNTYQDNGKNYIKARFRYDEDSKSYTFLKESVPYFCDEGLELGNRTTTTIEAGVKFAFNRGTRFYVGPETIVKAQGTAADPIVFAGAEDKPGYWQGAEIRTEQNDESVFAYCNFENAGSKDFFDDCAFLISTDAGFKFSNCNISRIKSKYGVRVEHAGNFVDNMKCDNITISDASKAKVIVNTGIEGVIEDEATLDGLDKIKMD